MSRREREPLESPSSERLRTSQKDSTSLKRCALYNVARGEISYKLTLTLVPIHERVENCSTVCCIRVPRGQDRGDVNKMFRLQPKRSLGCDMILVLAQIAAASGAATIRSSRARTTRHCVGGREISTRKGVRKSFPSSFPGDTACGVA